MLASFLAAAAIAGIGAMLVIGSSWLRWRRRGGWTYRAMRQAFGNAAFFVIAILGTVSAREVICSFQSEMVRWLLLPLGLVMVVGSATLARQLLSR